MSKVGPGRTEDEIVQVGEPTARPTLASARRGGTSPAVWALARAVLRRRPWASVGLALFVGLAAAAPMASWAAGRQIATTVDRFLERAHVADAHVTVCPPGFDPAGPGGAAPCFEYQPEQELGAIRSLPGVAHAARASYTLVRVATSADPTGWRARGLLSIADPLAFPTVLGDPTVVVGRLAAEDAPDELMVNEVMARALGLRPGDRLWVQVDGRGDDAGAGPPIAATVVGIVRTPNDLLTVKSDQLGILPIQARAGWSRAHAHELTSEATSLFVWLDDGDVGGFTARLQDRLGGQAFVVSAALDDGERSNLEQATSFESRAALAVAAVAGAAVAFLLAQVVSRQARSEASDVPTLLALGMTRRQVGAAAAARWAPVALAGAAVAVLSTVGASGLGPIGLARRGPSEPGLRADALVLVAGGVATAVIILIAGAVAVYRFRSSAPALPPTRASVARGSPGVRVGVALARRSFRRGGALPVMSALVGTAVGVAAVVTVSGGAASLRRVTTSPERFGAPWDALVRGDSDPERQQEVLASLAEVPGVVAAAAIPGNTVLVDGQEEWIQAMAPVEGLEPIRPVVTSGREPLAEDEVALGSITMRRLGVEVGDTVAMQSQLVGSEPVPFRVTGATMVSDGYEPNVGRGGLVALPASSGWRPRAPWIRRATWWCASSTAPGGQRLSMRWPALCPTA